MQFQLHIESFRYRLICDIIVSGGASAFGSSIFQRGRRQTLARFHHL